MKKKYKISREDLLSCCDENQIVDVDLASNKFNFPIHQIKNNCRTMQLRFKKTYTKVRSIETIQCPVCIWSGNFQFTTHILKSTDESHKEWLKIIIDSYHCLHSYRKVAKLMNLPETIAEKLLKTVGILKTLTSHKYHCPICNWIGFFGFPKHIRESNDDEHNNFKQDIIKKYVEEKMSPKMISLEYNISLLSIPKILKELNVKIRNHRESVINAIQQNRHNINAYGISGFRKDLNSHFRSIPEANFARILKFKNIEYQQEIPFNLHDENGTILTTYFLDFLIKGNQGFEIKGFGNDYEFKNKEKIVLFKKQYPNIKLKVLYCSGDEWKELEEKYSPLIPLWETQTRNLRTNPELYEN